MSRGVVLIVEDDRTTAELLKTVLEAAGFEILTAEEGLAACKAIREQEPDLILLDVMLPDMDGWELCSMIRSLPSPTLSRVPILMLTARATSEDRAQGLKAGADVYLTKPFQVEDVVGQVEQLIARRRPEPRANGEPEGPPAAGGELLNVVSFLCHELRNHLVAIGGFSRRIEQRAERLPPDQVKEHAAVIRRSSDYLSSLVERFLVFQKVESGRLELESEVFDLKEIVDDVVNLTRPLAEGRSMSVERDLPEERLPVRFNEFAARMCASNLVENAIKYGESRVRVRLRVGESGDEAVLEVEDDGPGVPEDQRERIFEKFYRSESAERSSKGSGLGLFIVKILAEALRAEVRVDRSPDEGARFELRVPRAEEHS